MARYFFDIETNGFLETLDTIHSIVLKDVDTGEVFSNSDSLTSASNLFPSIENALTKLTKADEIIGHNIIGFDIPAIQKVYPDVDFSRVKVFDTLLASRVIYPNLFDLDFINKGWRDIPGNFKGAHGLEAWGHRVGLWKGDYAKVMKEKGLDPWASWNADMQAYCEQDVEVTEQVYIRIQKRIAKDMEDDPSIDWPRCLELEHRVAEITAEQERYGFLFDQDAADELLRVLLEERAEAEGSLQSLFEPWYSFDGLTTPKRTVNYKSLERHSTWEGAPYSKVKLNVFNPGSRHHIADRLQKVRGWKPEDFTAKGQPKVDDDILSALPYPEAKQIAHYLMIQKRIGQLAEGRQAWLNNIRPDTGRIHGSVNTNGAVTGRMTHSNPNVAQVPSVGAPYGAECRALFTVPVDKKLVGVDVSGLELRMLAHFMNDEVYAKEVVEGDVHTANMNAAGLSDRNQAKTFIYAFLYGAGNEKIGSIVGKGAAHGGKLKARFLEQTPKLKKLIEGVQKKAKANRYLKGLDGRKLHVRHDHAALNTLLQSAGALVCKQWLVFMDEALREKGLKDRCQIVANIHDEHQYEVDEEIAEQIGELSIECIEKAGDHFGIRVPLTGDANIGDNWKETH